MFYDFQVKKNFYQIANYSESIVWVEDYVIYGLCFMSTFGQVDMTLVIYL